MNKKHLVLIICLLILIAILLLDWYLWIGGWPTMSQSIIWAQSQSPMVYTQIVFFMGFLAGHWLT